MRSAEIIPFGAAALPAPLHPPSIVPPPAFPPLARSRSDIRLDEIARRLRIEQMTPRSIVDKLRSLNAFSGFPSPKNPRIVKGAPVTGPRCIVRASVWDRGEVDDWFDHRDPPAVVAARRDGARRQLRADMKARAEALGDLRPAARRIATA